MESSNWNTGEFCWIDIMTNDLQSAKKFYKKIFNWNYEEVATPNGPYLFSSIAAGAVGGLGHLPEEMKKQNVPSYWGAYISVESVDATVTKAIELGGKVMAEAFDVMESGRMAAIASPSGATFCLWENKEKKDVPRTSGMQHGMYGWVELNTHDVDRDGGFYCKLFNWTPKTSDMGEGVSYTEFMVADTNVPAGGMMEIQKEWGDIPSHWSIYFSVNNINDSIKAIEEAGGKIIMPAFEVPNVGLLAVAQDPTGAHFSLGEWRLPESNC